MMNAKTAFEKVKEVLGNDIECRAIRRYIDRFAFFVAPAGSDKNEDIFVGRPIYVNIKNGEVKLYDDIEDDERLKLARQHWAPIELDELEAGGEDGV